MSNYKSPPNAPYGAVPQYPPPPGPPPGFGAPPPMPDIPGPPQSPFVPSQAPPYPPPHGFPQPQQAHGYAPQEQQIVHYLGTLSAAPGVLPAAQFDPYFNPEPTFNALRDATKGAGCKKDKVVAALAPLTPMQMVVLQHAFTTKIGKSLGPLLDGELSTMVGSKTDLQELVHGLVLGPLMCDAWIVHRALKGLGTRDDLLNEVLLSRSNEDLRLLIRAYPIISEGRSLLRDVQGDLTGKTERLFTMALAASRDTSLQPNYAAVEKDVAALYKAGQGRAGTDEITFCTIFVNSSPAHLAAVSTVYGTKHKSLSKVVKAEFSGHMRNALLHIISGVKAKRAPYGEGVWRDAKYIEQAMKGRGTDDFALICRILRASWNPARMKQIRAAYEARYNMTLEKRVKGETSGDYRTLLLALIAKGA